MGFDGVDAGSLDESWRFGRTGHARCTRLTRTPPLESSQREAAHKGGLLIFAPKQVMRSATRGGRSCYSGTRCVPEPPSRGGSPRSGMLGGSFGGGLIVLIRAHSGSPVISCRCPRTASKR